MDSLTWLLGLILAATLAAPGPGEPITPQKPVLSAELVPHMAATWDQRWLAEARKRFAERTPREEGRAPGLLLVLGLVIMIALLSRRELRREAMRGHSDLQRVPGAGLAHTLAPRWGLR